jgi:hypothetical protein
VRLSSAGARAAPDDPDDAIFDLAVDASLFDADGSGGEIDLWWHVIPRKGGNTALVRPQRELAHLRRRRLIRCRDADRVDPLDPAAAVPTGHDEPNRGAVIRRQRRAVHPDGEKRATRAQRVEGEDPTRAGGRRAR